MTRRVIGASLAVWMLLSVSLWAGGWEPVIVVLGGVLLVGGVLLFVAADLAGEVRPVTWPSATSRTRRAVPPAQHRERTQVLLAQMTGSERTDTAEIDETLRRVIDERLRVGHGIDRTEQPEAAADVLTPRLRALVGDDALRSTRPQLSSASELRSILSELEEL